MPLKHWIKRFDDDDINAIVKNGVAPYEEVYRHWIKLSDEVIKKHGLPSKFKKYIKQVNRVNLAYSKYLISNKRHDLFLAEQEDILLSTMKTESIKVSFNEQKTSVQRMIGNGYIDPNVWTVDEYYYALADIKKANESN